MKLDLSWIDKAPCRNHLEGGGEDYWHNPSEGEPGWIPWGETLGNGRTASGEQARRQRIARGFCSVCPVDFECLKLALECEPLDGGRYERVGFWAGMSPAIRARYAATLETIDPERREAHMRGTLARRAADWAQESAERRRKAAREASSNKAKPKLSYP
jgi:hypothetical protein